MNSTKPAHGHAMGASGALEAVAAIESMRRGRVPPTLNLDEPDPALPPLDFVRGTARERAPSVVLSNSFGFGGTNAVLVLKRFDERRTDRLNPRRAGRLEVASLGESPTSPPGPPAPPSPPFPRSIG